ncbi:MAG: hypothetical protein L0Z62_12580 [Gemmataceae bacterium]|nr:hypothetical protein [Gemmataceae bacterium]
MPGTSDDISGLLRRAQASGPLVTEFAWVWLETYRRDVLGILRQQRRGTGARGHEAAAAWQRTERRLEFARLRLKGRLVRLLGWATASGSGKG